MPKTLISTGLALAVMALSGCMQPTAGGPQTYSLTTDASAAEQDLQQRTRAYQRTLVEATASGAIIGGASGGPGGGVIWGAGVGLFAGSYVSFLQQEYSDRESALEELQADLQLINADMEATIATMRSVVAQQQQRLAQIAADPNQAGLRAQELADSYSNRANMDRIIEGATEWQAQFQEARSLAQSPAEQAQIDPQLARLSQRIAEMRQIASSLAA